MALPVASAVKTAIETLFAALSEFPSRHGMGAAIQSLEEIAGALNRAYPAPKPVTFNDEQYATVAALQTAEALAPGNLFRVTNATNDTTNNALATAKGSAVAANDIFVIVSGGVAAYITNNATNTVFDFAGERFRDFIGVNY